MAPARGSGSRNPVQRDIIAASITSGRNLVRSMLLVFLSIGLLAPPLPGPFGIGGGIFIVPAVLIALGLFVGAWLGARLAQTMNPMILKRGFSPLPLLSVAARLWVMAE
jgi:uncharacterized membrane protein YfcA